MLDDLSFNIDRQIIDCAYVTLLKMAERLDAVYGLQFLQLISEGQKLYEKEKEEEDKMKKEKHKDKSKKVKKTKTVVMEEIKE